MEGDKSMRRRVDDSSPSTPGEQMQQRRQHYPRTSPYTPSTTAYNPLSPSPGANEISGYSTTSARERVLSNPSLTNPMYAQSQQFPTSYYISPTSNAEASRYSTHIDISPVETAKTFGTESTLSKRASTTIPAFQESTSHHSKYPTSTSYNSAQYPPYYQSTHASFSHTTTDTVTSRTIAGSTPYIPNTGQSYMLSGKSTIPSINKSPPINNNGPIALVLIPPLLLLLVHEMTTAFPMLLFLCLGLIVYALDLANPGDRGSRSSGGYYTLFAVWVGWVVLSMGVLYDTVVLRERDWNYGVELSRVDTMGGVDESGGENDFVGRDSGSFVGILVLVFQVAVSISLLFCLATWVTLQFQWLPQQMPTLTYLLERTLHFTLPPIAAAITAHGLTSIILTSSYVSWGVDSLAILLPYYFALHLSICIWLVGAAPSMLTNIEDDESRWKEKGDRKDQQYKSFKSTCAISPREGRFLSYLLVLTPMLIHSVAFRQRIFYSYASWDDLFDLTLIATAPYLLHYLLAFNGVFDERWRCSLNWVLKAGTSTVEGGRTVRDVLIPMAISFLGCISFQQRYLVPLCARASYILNGHEGVISTAMASTFLTLGTLLLYTTVWFFGRQCPDGTVLLGEYHEDVFQLLLGASAVFFGMSCSPPWSILPIPMLLAESLALWVLTKQLRYAMLTMFVYFTCVTVIIAYKLTFLSETIEILPSRRISLKTFAQHSMWASMGLILLVGLVYRAPGGAFAQTLKRFDATGCCVTMYSLFLVVLEFSLLRCPMPLYSRDNLEVGRVAVYSSFTAYFTGFLSLVVGWHLCRHKFIKIPSAILSSSIAIGKMVAVLIEDNHIDGDDSLRMIFHRWLMTTTLLITLSIPYFLRPVYVKITIHPQRGSSRKARNILPQNAGLVIALYGAVALPIVIVMSVQSVIEPLLGILIGYDDAAPYSTGPKFSEVIGYSVSLWGLAVFQMINHFLPDGGGEFIRRLSALVFVFGLFVSFSAPAFPGSNSVIGKDSIFELDTDNDTNSGGYGLISTFLAILLSVTGPLELREMRDASGRKDTRHLLRLMIFGLMFGCGLAWFITMQSMSKDVFIPIFVTSFSTMAMSFLGTVTVVMGYFLDTKDFAEAEQIANVWAGVGFPIFFFISSVSLSAHARPFGIGGWASTYLSVCGMFAGTFAMVLRSRDKKSSKTREYGNLSCIFSWLCAISVVYGRYGVAGIGIVGTTAVAGIPLSVLGTFICSPILVMLEAEPVEGNMNRRRITTGLTLPLLTSSNWFVPPLAGTVATFVLVSLYAIFIRGCGLSKLSLLFGTGSPTDTQDDVFSHIYGVSHRAVGMGPLDDVASVARKSVIHNQAMINAVRLNESGIWTSKNLIGPAAHLLSLLMTLPSLHRFIRNSWIGSSPPTKTLTILLPLNILAMIFGRGIPSIVAAATVAFVGGLIQISSSNG